MILLPSSPTAQASLLKKEAAKCFSMSPKSFRQRLLDTGIIEENFLGQIWANHCTQEYVEGRIKELGLNFKVTPTIRIKPLQRKVA